METITLVDLGPVIAAVVGPMLVSVAMMLRYQHKDSTKTRELIVEARDEARALNSDARDEARALNDATRVLIEQHSRQHNENLKEMARSLSDTRERLARIEGHFGIGIRPRDDEDGAANVA